MTDKAAPPMWRAQRPCFEELKDHLGAADTVRLYDLLNDGGLTPSEARPWLEPPTRDWAQVESLLFTFYDLHDPQSYPLPWHIARWMERYREQHIRPLFDD